MSLCVIACGNRQQNAASTKDAVDYASREPGSDVPPTTDESFQLLDADGPTRLATVQQIVAGTGKKCAAVTRAVLEGGLDGTDEWRVRCTDTGTWQLWFRADGSTDVASCPHDKCP